MSKFNRTIFNLFGLVRLHRKTFAEDSVGAGKVSWILYLGPDNKGTRYVSYRQLRVSWGWVGNCHPFYVAFNNGWSVVEFCTGHTFTSINKGHHGLWWNSEHIARRFGKFIDLTDEYGNAHGGPDSVYEYRGILGNHTYL